MVTDTIEQKPVFDLEALFARSADDAGQVCLPFSMLLLHNAADNRALNMKCDGVLAVRTKQHVVSIPQTRASTGRPANTACRFRGLVHSAWRTAFERREGPTKSHTNVG